MADVFMSYSREDKHIARNVATALEDEGFSVWWDAALRAGEAYDEVTERNLRQASAVVVLWSTRSVNSKWVRAEATVGERSSILVPALIEECDRPIRFELVQTADLTRWHGDRTDPHWRDFVSDIRNAVGDKPESQETSASSAPVAAATSNGEAVTIETTFWTSVKDGNDRSDFEAYLARYPNGHFAALARNRIAALERAKEAQARPAAAPPPSTPPQARAAAPSPARAPSPPPAEAKKSPLGAIIGVSVFVIILGVAITFALMRKPSAQGPIVAAASETPATETIETSRQPPENSQDSANLMDAPAVEGPPAEAEPVDNDSVDTEELPGVAETTDDALRGDMSGVLPHADNSEAFAAAIPAETGQTEDAAPASTQNAPVQVAPSQSGTYRDCEFCPLMTRAPGGTFLMGSPATEAGRNAYEGPQREVTIKPFAIGVYEVTQGEWGHCVDHGACTAKQDNGDENDPVLGVDWREANAYAKWLSKKTGKTYRLPTEAEWEYAARAGTTTAYWWGDSFDPKRVATGAPKPVGSFASNAFGVYDMLGNAREWVEDCYVNNYRAAPTDGSAVLNGDCSLRVIRGGAWSSSRTDMRIANRSRIGMTVAPRYMGVRVVSDDK